MRTPKQNGYAPTLVSTSDGREVNIADGYNDDGVQRMELSGSSIAQPTDAQARLQTTVQTHNAVSVAASTSSAGSWIDTDGYDEIGVTALNDAQTTSTVALHWSNDGTSLHGAEVLIAASTTKEKVGATSTKARYARISLNNGDTAAHTMSAWAYLKV